MPKTYKEEVENGWYITLPNKSHNKLTVGEVVNYPTSGSIEIFNTEEEYITRCEELEIDLTEDEGEYGLIE
tara:strand:+ start:181 stop:393 length:213 start_codon:yes stop_codon:yes gene_type:complete